MTRVTGSVCVLWSCRKIDSARLLAEDLLPAHIVCVAVSAPVVFWTPDPISRHYVCSWPPLTLSPASRLWTQRSPADHHPAPPTTHHSIRVQVSLGQRGIIVKHQPALSDPILIRVSHKSDKSNKAVCSTVLTYNRLDSNLWHYLIATHYCSVILT